MRKRFKWLAATLGIALLLGILATGAAFAEDPAPDRADYHRAFLGRVASILGVGEQELVDAFTQARGEMIDEAVQEGRITPERAEAMKERRPGSKLGPGVWLRGGKRAMRWPSRPNGTWRCPLTEESAQPQ